MNRSEIRTNVRLLLNESTAGFWADADLDKCIDMANAKVNSIISSVREDFFTVSATFPTVAGQRSYAMPSDCRFIRRMEIYDASNSNNILKLEEFRFPRIEASGPWPFQSSGQPVGYVVRGEQFDLLPICDAVYTLRLYYDVRQDNLSGDSSSPSSPSDYHDAIVFWSCVLATMINGNPQEDSTGQFSTMFSLRKEELINSLLRRGSDDPKAAEAYLENFI